MAVPSSGIITMIGIFSEKNENDYSAFETEGEVDFSLRGLSTDAHDDSLSMGQCSDLNTLNLSSNRPDENAPHAMSEMRGIRFASGNSPTTGAISLSDFRNRVLTPVRSQQAKIQASDRQASDKFGYSVSISGDGNTAIAGAYNEDTGATDAGSAYIFTRSGTTWTQQAKIQASDKQASDNFGWSVAISDDGNTTIAGAFNEDTGGTDTGAAYIFEKSYYI